jgi:small subunit ribosomal protein S20
VRRTVVNKSRRSRLRSVVRKVEEAISAGDRSRAVAAMAEAEPVIIRAAQKKRRAPQRGAAQGFAARSSHSRAR